MTAEGASPTRPAESLPVPLSTTREPTTSSPLSRTARYLRRYRLLAAGLLLLALVVYLLGNNLFPLVDRDEPRYAEASREMLASGNWVKPTFLGEPRLKKPPLIYWAQATSMQVFGDNAFAARLPSSLASVLTLGVLAIALPRIVGYRRSLWAIFVFATALMPAYLAKVCMTDAVLHLWIAIAMLGLYAVWRGTARWPTYVALGISIGLAMLTKGPPVFLYLGMTLLALWALNQTTDRLPPGRMITLDVERAVPFVFARVAMVFGIAILICVPWVIAFERVVPGGIVSMFSREVLSRSAEGAEGHWGPPGYYAVTFWATYFPWCLFWPAAIVHAWRRRHLPWVRFCLAAVLGPWFFLEIYATKLPHYWLPSYPYMAILTADVLIRGVRARIVDFRERGFLWGATAFAAMCGLAGIAVCIPPWLGNRPIVPGVLAGLVLAAGFGLLGWGTLSLLKRRELDRAALVLGFGTWALLVFTTNVYWPFTPALTLAQRVGLSLRTIGATHSGEVQMLEFKEPSTAFYQGGTIREQSDRGFLRNAGTTPLPRYVVVDERYWREFMSPLERIHWPIVGDNTFVGLNVAKGLRRERVLILENRLPPTTVPSTK